MRIEGHVTHPQDDIVQKAAGLLAPVKAATYEMMHITEGSTLLDVRCGSGADTLHLAALTGKRGRVWGIDADLRMIARAERAARSAGVADRVRYLQADAARLPFPDGTFDAVSSARMVQHIADPQAAAAEMARVLKPGGWLVLADADHSSTSVDNAFPDAEWTLRRHHTSAIRNGFAGRTLYGLLKRRGLKEVSVRPVPLIITQFAVWKLAVQWDQTSQALMEWGYLTQEAFTALTDDLRRRDGEGSFWGYGLYMVTAGRKP